MNEKMADIVVVDRDDQTRAAAEEWMRDEGYDAHCVASGGAAVRFLDAYRPKFAVLDLTTLGAEGLDVLENVRREPRLRNSAVVVHVAVPELYCATAGEPGAFRSQPYLTHGIHWPGMRAEIEKYVQ
jgi:CheY-like chemotaxis protein